MAFSWGKTLKAIAKGLAKALSLGLIGRGEKTRKAGEVAETVIDEATKAESPRITKDALDKIKNKG